MKARAFLALFPLAFVVSCVTRTELGADPFTVPFVLADRATCSHDDADRFHCLGDGRDARLGVTPSSLGESCVGGPCTSIFEQTQNASIVDVALFDDGGCFGVGDGVVCAGRNDFGQGGVARDASVTVVLRYAGANFHPVDVDAGVAHVCALTDTSQVLCWGLGAHGQLGVDPATLDDCGTASASDAARLSVLAGSTVRCSGTPHLITGIDDAIGLATTDFGTCVLRASGELRCFGSNALGALGLPSAVGLVVMPTRVAIEPALAIDASAGNVCALLREGTLRCAGANDAGQLGSDANDEDCGGVPCVRAFERVPVGRVEDFAIGDHSLYVVDDAARLWARGAGGLGELGDGASTHETTCDVDCSRSFVRPHLPRHVLAVRAGADHACALLTDGRTFCFGGGASGQTGSSFHEDALEPVEIALP